MTESGNPPIVRGDESTQHEHGQVREIARQIATAHEIDTVLFLLKEHQAMLRHHFAVEEADDGLFRAIVEKAPERIHDCQQLRLQHQQILAEIDDLWKAAQGDTLIAQQEIFDRSRAIAKQLSDHESAESDLLMDVFNRDLGTGD